MKPIFKHGFLDLEQMVIELKTDGADELTVDQVLELRKIELLGEIKDYLGTIIDERLM